MKYAYKGPLNDEGKAEMRSCLDRLLGDKLDVKKPCFRFLSAVDRGSYLEKMLVFTSEENAEVPCCLLLPKGLP